MKIKRKIELEFPVSLSPWEEKTIDLIGDQLADQGFVNIERAQHEVTGIRGKWWWALLVTDPRRLYQTISVKQTAVVFKLSTWWCFFAVADEKILEIEASGIEARVSKREIDPSEMIAAQRRRRWSDARSLVITIFITVAALALIGFVILICSDVSTLD